MTFSSLLFAFFFLPFIVVIYFLSKEKYRNYILLSASLLFRRNSVFCALWRIVTLICINFGWVIFNAEGIRDGIKYILAMLGGYGMPFAMDGGMIRYMREYGFFLAAGVIFAMPVMKHIKIRIKGSKLSAIAGMLSPVGCGVIFLWAVSFIILGIHNPFIYFNF